MTEYLEDALAPHERERFEVHLRHCDVCVRYLEQLRVTIAQCSAPFPHMSPNQRSAGARRFPTSIGPPDCHRSALRWTVRHGSHHVCPSSRDSRGQVTQREDVVRTRRRWWESLPTGGGVDAVAGDAIEAVIAETM